MKEICTPALALIDRLGDMACFLAEGFHQTFRTRRLASKVMRQVYVIGANSMFVILLIGLFTGLVLGLQAFYAMSMFGAQGMLGSLLALTLIREMAPVLTAVMITARAGSAMTAEIGVMRISDQIDALEVMDIHPVGYLVTPRLLASLITFPLLTSIFTVIGIFGGYLSACVLLSLNGYFCRVKIPLQIKVRNILCILPFINKIKLYFAAWRAASFILFLLFDNINFGKLVA